MKRQKLCKDEATFVKGKPQAEVRYWPCEYQDEKVAAEHRKYKVYPVGQITEYCKHVPYRSEKKTFLSKTGREGFHVMWDYNIGLVRVTPFFKALEYPKTTPARMLGKNPGLKEICHSITGGSLTAQGYWMPFEAAKAVAATFCYRIRYVLTPIFGLDFPAQCIPPGAPGFDSMHVAPKIILECVEATKERCGFDLGLQAGCRPESPVSAGVTGWTAANIRPKPLKMIETESGYGTDTDRSDTYLCSPVKSARRSFKTRATPRSSGVQEQYEQSYVRAYAASETGSESDFSSGGRKRKRNPPRYMSEEYDSPSTDWSEDCSIPARPYGTKESRSPPPMTDADENAGKILIEFSKTAVDFSKTARVLEGQETGKDTVTEKRRASL
ncbi:MAG: hypothetical protein Q9166_001530 [cf. Caloplaca sp. 2 TL-2023]